MKKIIIFFLSVVLSTAAFAQVKISDLPTLTTNPSGGWIPITIGGVTKKIDGANLGYTKVDTFYFKKDSAYLLKNNGVLYGQKLSTVLVINPPEWGMISYDVNAAFDNGPKLQAAIDYAQTKGLTVILNSGKDWTLKTSVRIRKGVRFFIGMGDHILLGADNVKMFIPETGCEFVAAGDGAIDLNSHKGVGVFFDGITYDYGNAKGQPFVHVNVTGQILTGQTGMWLSGDGQGTYGKGAASYIRDIYLAANNLDTALYISAVNRGNCNNNEITFIGGKNIHGCVMYADTLSAGPGKTSVSGNKIHDNITSAQWALNLFSLKGNCIENKIDMKFEDVGRDADSLTGYMIYCDQYTNTNHIDAGSLVSSYIFNGNPSNNITSYRSDGITTDALIGNNGVMPTGSTFQPGGNESDYLAGIIDNPTIGYVATDDPLANTHNDLKKPFDLSLNSSWVVTDANTTARHLYIVFPDTLNNPQTLQVTFEKYFWPRYYKIEAHSTDSSKRYTLFETADTVNYTSGVQVSFKSKIIYQGLRNRNKNGVPITDTFQIRKDLNKIDSIIITIRGNNWVNNISSINLAEVALTVEKQRAQAYLGVGGQINDTAYQKIAFKGGIDMQNQYIQNALFYNNDVWRFYQALSTFDVTVGTLGGRYRYNNGTPGTRPPSSTNGFVDLTVLNTQNTFDGSSTAIMTGYDKGTGLYFSRYFNGTSWSTYFIAPGLPGIGTGNQIIGMSNDATAFEYKTLTAGAGVSINHTAGGITISTTGGGGSGTVNNGSQYQLAYYNASGNTVGPLTAITPYSRVVTDNHGLPVAQAEVLHQSVDYGTNGPLPSSTYNNGTGGVGATITGTANGVLNIDGAN